MLFNTFNFWCLFPLIFVVYWAIHSRWNKLRTIWLLILSYLLYLNFRPLYGIILVGVTAITYIGALLIDRYRKYSRILLTLSLLGSFLPLFIFKYADFVDNSINSLLDLLGVHFMLPGLNWAIPVGISFYTFQAVGYLIDVYRQRIHAEVDVINYALFCSFFPQTASGPISRYEDLMPQLKTARTFNYEQTVSGLKILLWGMFLKLALADRLGIYVDTVYSNYSHYSGTCTLIASLFYTLQIYGDFAGYSLMAIGIAKCLGFDLINNFNRPYFAESVSEFWKRWHISLTRWLTNYVYISLGGSRCSKIKHYFNILVTFLVSGLWHGANWTFVIWGGMHGLLQMIEKAIGLDPKGKYTNHKKLKRLMPLRIAITFMLVSTAWIFFRIPTLSGAWKVVVNSYTFADGRFEEIPHLYLILISIGIVFIRELSEEFFPEKISLFSNKYIIVRWTTYLMLIVYIILFGVLDASQFIYVSF